tara:strand:- start:634 stop:1821 length:1188 start_codon:yes stop_codon:yes gene_type:complete
MAYGITIANKDGVSLIDESSKQVQTGKSGSVTPGRFSSDSFSVSPSSAVVLSPKSLDTSFLFIKVRQASGSSQVFPMDVSCHKGTVSLTLTKASGGASGSNVFYANLSTGTPTAQGVSYVSAGVNAGISNSSFHDVGIGDAIPGTSSYVSGGNASAILLETGGSYSVKVTLDKTLTSSISNGTTFVMTKDVVFFTRRYSNAWNSGWVLDFVFGEVTNNEDETATYGMQVFDSGGTLAWSSNRENFLIDSVTSGDSDLGVDASGTSYGEANNEVPRFGAEIGDASNWEDYWTLVTAYGFCTFTATGSGSYGGQRSWGAGYIFCPPGNGDYANSFFTNNPWGTSNTLFKSSSSANGVCMAPINLSYYSTPVSGAGGSGINDAWATDATRTLVIGHFI